MIKKKFSHIFTSALYFAELNNLPSSIGSIKIFLIKRTLSHTNQLNEKLDVYIKITEAIYNCCYFVVVASE
jgi:hypothetical protein